MKTKSKSPKTNEEMEVVKSNEKNWDDEARRYIEGVAALLIADSRAGPLLAGTGSGDEVEERVASVLHSLLADRDAWPATARPLRDHILGSLDALTALLITKLEAGVGLKRKAAAATAVKSGARPAKKARKGDEKEEDEDEEADAFAAFGRSGSQAALSALKQDLDDKARTALYTQLLLAPATAERALSNFMAHSQEKLTLADRLLRLQLLTFAAPTDEETSAGLRSCAAITREIHDVMQNEGAHDDAKLSVLKVLAGHMAACDSRRRLASHPSTAPLPDHVKQRRAAHRQRRVAGQWTGRYHLALADLLKEYIKVASLLSSEFAVRKVYPGLLFSVSLASEGDTRLPLALLGALCELTHSDADADSAAQARLRVVAHKLFFDFFVSEERVLRSNASATSTKKKTKTAATVQQALSQDPPVHYVRFALMAKRSVEFWGGRKEQQLTQRREEEIKLRKRKDVLATRTTEAGGDLEELRMLEATIDAGYKVPMPPSLKAALAHKLGGKDQFHFRNITEDELLELLVTPRSTKTEQNEEDEGENDVIVVGDEDEDEEAENGEEEEDTNAAEADGGDGEESAPIFVIDTKGAPTPKHTAKPAAAADKEKAAAPSSLQRDVAALLEQLSEEEEE